MNLMVVFHEHWEEFDAWRADPAHPRRRGLPLLEAVERFTQEQEEGA